MATTVEPSALDDGVPMVKAISARDLRAGMIVTNLGLIQSHDRYGVFVVTAIRGTIWSLGSGKGDIATIDVVWHESVQVTVDVL